MARWWWPRPSARRGSPHDKPGDKNTHAHCSSSSSSSRSSTSSGSRSSTSSGSRSSNSSSGDCGCDGARDGQHKCSGMSERSPRRLTRPRGRSDDDAHDGKVSAVKTRTGNALAQFVVLMALTGVAYQYLTSGDELATAVPSKSHASPSPWSDAALQKHRDQREVVSTTEFSMLMACVGLFGLMQRKTQSSLAAEEEREARRHAQDIQRCLALSRAAIASEDTTGVALPTEPSSASFDVVAALPMELQQHLLLFVPPKDLVTTAMLNTTWHDQLTGDACDTLWQRIFQRDFLESGVRFRGAGLVARLGWRQFYFQHHLSRAVEIARLMDREQARKCVVIEGEVFDVTEFLEVHPGGLHVIGDVIGTDASELWDQFQHSQEAKTLMREFVVDDAVLAIHKQQKQQQQEQEQEQEQEQVAPKPACRATVVLRGNLTVVQQRWKHVSWCLAHAHLFGSLSPTFLDLSLRLVDWRYRTRGPKRIPAVIDE